MFSGHKKVLFALSISLFCFKQYLVFYSRDQTPPTTPTLLPLEVPVPSHKTPTPTPTPTPKLLFLHYHKTGHDLSRILATRAFREEQFVKFKRSKPASAVVEAQRQPSTSDSKISVVAAVDLTKHWDQLLDTQVVHFVRDPLDWVLSAYLYHSQRPIPRPERRWITRSQGTDACNVTRGSSSLLSMAGLLQISTCCRSLTDASIGLAEQLSRLSEKDGVRLEAARGLLGSDHGDLALMAQHLEVSRNSSAKVLTLFLADFTTTKETFQASARTLCKFGLNTLMANNRTIEDCIEDSVRYGWMDTNTTQSAHVTSNRRSSIEKYAMKQLLLKDAILGPPLRLVQQYVLSFRRASYG
jgi:hypothetical protein